MLFNVKIMLLLTQQRGRHTRHPFETALIIKKKKKTQLKPQQRLIISHKALWGLIDTYYRDLNIILFVITFILVLKGVLLFLEFRC